MNYCMREVLAQLQDDARCVGHITAYELTQPASKCPSAEPHAEFAELLILPAITMNSMLWLTFPDPAAGSQKAHADLQTHERLPEERPVAVTELLTLQGWPGNGPVVLGEHKPRLLGTMAGSMVSAPVALALVSSLISSIPWLSAPEAEECADVGDEDVTADLGACDL